MDNWEFTEEFLVSRQTTSGYFFRALLETAEENGGEVFRGVIAEAAVNRRSLWPEPEALRLMEAAYPGSTEVVVDRAGQIQAEAHAAERALRSRKFLSSATFRGMLAGLTGFSPRSTR